MVICAMLTALSVLLTRFVSPQIGDAMRFSFGTIPIMLSGILFGPVYGFVVGVAEFHFYYAAVKLCVGNSHCVEFHFGAVVGTYDF